MAASRAPGSAPEPAAQELEEPVPFPRVEAGKRIQRPPGQGDDRRFSLGAEQRAAKLPDVFVRAHPRPAAEESSPRRREADDSDPSRRLRAVPWGGLFHRTADFGPIRDSPSPAQGAHSAPAGTIRSATHLAEKSLQFRDTCFGGSARGRFLPVRGVLLPVGGQVPVRLPDRASASARPSRAGPARGSRFCRAASGLSEIPGARPPPKPFRTSGAGYR